MSVRTYPGDSSPIWEVGYEDSDGNLVTLDGNYTCKIVAVKEGQAGKTVDRSVTDKNGDSSAFLAALTEAETTSLGEGEHGVSVWIFNATAGITRRRQFTFLISTDGIPAPT